MHDHHGHAQDHSHDPAEGHDHGHSHPEAGERKLVPQQAAVLDIGGDVGALLVQTGPDLEGAEIELYDERGGYVMHTEVHGREVAGNTRYAGLFPTVLEGTYLLEIGDGSPRQRITVTGGQVETVQHQAVAASS